jgi:hypothetical protein
MRDGEAESLGCLEVDNKIELGRPLNRDVGGLYTSQQHDALLGENVSIELGEVWAIGNEATFLGRGPPFVHGRQAQCRNPTKDDLAIDEEVRGRKHTLRPSAPKLFAASIALTISSGLTARLIKSSTPRVRAWNYAKHPAPPKLAAPQVNATILC